MDDLVARLRSYDSKNHRGKYAKLCREAADEVERLRSALREIANCKICKEAHPRRTAKAALRRPTISAGEQHGLQGETFP